MKKIFRMIDRDVPDTTREFWMSKTPEERVEAVETIREHHYQMLGYTETPRIKKIIRIVRLP